MVLATFAGVVRGQRDLAAAFARTLSQGQLRVLGFRLNRKTLPDPLLRKGRPFPRAQRPSMRIGWNGSLCAGRKSWSAHGGVIAIDGKTLRHARGVQLVSSFGVESGRWLGTIAVADQSNEIPAAQALAPDRQNVEGKLVVMDAP